MAVCETCGNDYDKTFEVVHNGKSAAPVLGSRALRQP